MAPPGWKPVVFAGDLDPCDCCEDEPFCALHGMHFAECSCLGPTEDGVQYRTFQGKLYGRRRATLTPDGPPAQAQATDGD